MKRLYVTLQILLPHHLLSRLVGAIAQSRWKSLTRALIRAFIRTYRVDMSQARIEDPEGYASFTDFFVRELKQDARPLDGDPTVLISPCDGTLSQIGEMNAGTLVQAKGLDYSAEELFGAHTIAAQLQGGLYATIYLAPADYHRVHTPTEGKLIGVRHIPGRLFSVNPTTTARVSNLFIRNERVVMSFDTHAGPLVMVLVGAMIVGSIHTRWTGKVTRDHRIDAEVSRGEEVAQFRMGSTVILCVPRDTAKWDAHLVPGCGVLLGQRLGTLVGERQT